MLSLPPLARRVVRATMLAGGTRVGVAQTAGGVTLTLPPGAGDQPYRVLVVETRSR